MCVAAAAILPLLAFCASGCFTVNGASGNAVPAVKIQASNDLDCPQKNIRVVKEWGGRFEVVGCGHRAVYNTGCDGLRCTAAPLGQVVPWGDRPEPTPTGTGCMPDTVCNAN